MAWPIDDIVLTNVDGATDDPGIARADIANSMQRIKDIIAAIAVASGVCPLDAAALVPAANIPSDYVSLPSGTVMLFYQAVAPTGWTKLTTQNDKALRVVSGAGGGAGGTHALSSPPSTAHTHTGPSHTHTGPSHYHSYTGVIAHTHTFSTSSDGNHTHGILGTNTVSAGTINVSGHGDNGGGWAGGAYADAPYIVTAGAHTHSGTTASAGAASANTSTDGTGATGASGTGATSSNGPTAFSPQYIDVIICSKN